VGLERGPLSLVSTIEVLRGRKRSGSDLEIREFGRRDPRADRARHLSTKAGTNFADKRRSLGRYVRSRTQTTEFFVVVTVTDPLKNFPVF
jgi:hypothetical protein